jgi:hypothetical protein
VHAPGERCVLGWLDVRKKGLLEAGRVEEKRDYVSATEDEQNRGLYRRSRRGLRVKTDDGPLPEVASWPYGSDWVLAAGQANLTRDNDKEPEVAPVLMKKNFARADFDEITPLGGPS